MKGIPTYKQQLILSCMNWKSTLYKLILIIMLMKLPVNTLMTIPATLLMNMPAQTQLVTCNCKLSAINTMLNMMITHYVKQYTDQRMSHTRKMARNFCCHKLLICLIKTISNCYIIHNLKVCAIMSMINYSHETSTKHVLGSKCRILTTFLHYISIIAISAYTH